MQKLVTKTQIGTNNKVVLDEYSCDNCGATVIASRGDITDAFGFHGVVQEIRENSGSGNVSWFACKEDCILPAIKNALQKDWES